MSRSQCKVKLVVLNGCHSYILGKILSEYVENVICVHPYVQIMDKSATVFTTAFYDALNQHANIKTTLSQPVLMAFMTAKKSVKEQCGRDRKCRYHSHRRPTAHGHCHQKLHFGPLGEEKWDRLQQIIDSADDDAAKFRAYRSEMKGHGVIPDDQLDFDLYDGNTLKLCNVTENKLALLRQYLCDELSGEEMKEHDVPNRSDFVARWEWREDPNYEELSVGYFKFQSKAHRNLARQKLNELQREEAIGFSDRKSRELQDDHKVAAMTNPEEADLGWYHRLVPRCCCSPQHPHLAEDKLILLQNGRILNRPLIDNFNELQRGKKWRAERVRRRRERTARKDQAERPSLRNEPKRIPLSVSTEEEGADSCSSGPADPRSVSPPPTMPAGIAMDISTTAVQRGSTVCSKGSGRKEKRRSPRRNVFLPQKAKLSGARSISRNESEFGSNSRNRAAPKRNVFGANSAKRTKSEKSRRNDFSATKKGSGKRNKLY